VAEPAAEAEHPEVRRVLVVDDNADSADTLCRLLRSSGFDAQTAYDGPSALAAADATTPDAVVLDIGLPGLSGYDVARQIRQRPWGRRPLLIALTGWGQDAERARTAEAGFDHHLVKPVTFDALLAILGRPAQVPG
jgi:CheY-like chemotaxis protein